MASKGEISAAILRGNRDVQQVFGGLMDTQLDTRVQQGEGTWTAGDILGHLAGREQVYAMMFQAARGDNPFAAISDFNAWNEARVAICSPSSAPYTRRCWRRSGRRMRPSWRRSSRSGRVGLRSAICCSAAAVSTPPRTRARSHLYWG